MTWWKWFSCSLLSLLSLCILLFSLIACRRPTTPCQNCALLERRVIAEIHRFQGTPRSRHPVFLSSPITARIQEVLCEQGASIEEGQILFIYQDQGILEGPPRQTWIPELRSPIQGTVQSIHARPGDLVFGENECFQPTLLAVLGQQGPVAVGISLSPWDIRKLREGMPATIHGPDGAEHMATVSLISSETSCAEILPLEEVFPNLSPEVLVEIQIRKDISCLAAPIQAIRVNQGRPSMLALRSGKEISVPIEVGATNSWWVEVKGDLEEGDLVRIHP